MPRVEFEPGSLGSAGSAEVPKSQASEGTGMESLMSSFPSQVIQPTNDEKSNVQSLHGSSAARRRAITELLFFASVGDLTRCKRIVGSWHLDVSDPSCCDYDRRTPMHLAAAEGCYQILEWLMDSGADVNQLDRFKRTPLEDAVKANSMVVAKLLISRGGKVFETPQGLVELENSGLAGRMGLASHRRLFNLASEWEIARNSLEILEKLGEGEFGVVHKARWCGTLVAAKLLKGSSDIVVGDFQAEVETLSNVHHPNAVQFLGACTGEQPYVLVTELMAGGSLADAFLLPKSFPMRRALEIALDAARGMAYLHHSRVPALIHRDLKPGNLMLAGSLWQSREQLAFESGVVKIADFGLSKTLPTKKFATRTGPELSARLAAAQQQKQQPQSQGGAGGGSGASTSAAATAAAASDPSKTLIPGTFKLTGETGSYRYMAPEVFRHEPYNSSVDVYSYSMIVYQLFEHQPPFVGMDPVGAARAASDQLVRPAFIQLMQPRPLVNEIRELISRCWSPDPDQRPGFQEICAILESIISRAPRGKGKSGTGGLGTKGVGSPAAAAAAAKGATAIGDISNQSKEEGCCSVA